MTFERFGYRFKTGEFAGKTMEQVMLRRAPSLYSMVKWAADQPHLHNLVEAFGRLRDKLSNAPIVVHCGRTGCKRTPVDMTLPLGYDGYYWPDPSFWCRKHGPPIDGEIHVKMPISFDTLTSFQQKKNRSAVHRSLLKALGIKRPSRITEKFACDYFASLS